MRTIKLIPLTLPPVDVGSESFSVRSSITAVSRSTMSAKDTHAAGQATLYNINEYRVRCSW